MTETLTLVFPKDEHDLAVVGYRERAALVLTEAKALAVVDDPTKATAIGLLSALARTKAEAESKRVGIVKPPNDYVKQVNALFKSVLAPIEEADALLRTKLLTFDREQKRKAAEALAAEEAARLRSEALLREAEKAEAEGHAGVAESLLNSAVANEQAAVVAKTEAIGPAKTTATPMGAATVRMVWTFEVEDLGKVPAEYLELKHGAVVTAIQRGLREIPGLRIFQTESLSVRR